MILQLLQAILLSILVEQNSLHSFIFRDEMQSQCVQSTIGNANVLAFKELDVDIDGRLDEVIVYGGEDLNLLIVSASGTDECKILLNEYLTSRKLINSSQIVTIRNIEIVEVTGDAQPEIHVWLEKSNGGFRQNVALHAIYSLKAGHWIEVLRLTQCLEFGSFEIREGQPEGPKIIYVDEDRHCEPPLSSSRTYTFMRWNGSRFLPAETGTIQIPFWQTVPTWVGLICLVVVPFVLIGIGLAFLITLLKKIKK